MPIQHLTTLAKPLIIKNKKLLVYFTDTIPEGEITLQQEANFFLIGLIKEGWTGTRHLTIKTKGRKAKAEMVFFILGSKSDTMVADIQAIHQAQDTRINISLRSALTDQAVCHIAGNCTIEKNASGADTYFAHHTLILSEEAQNKSSPNLEIKTDSVKAGHSASVGKIDEEALFYLLSRGLEEPGARVLLVQGFFEKSIMTIPDVNTQQTVRDTIKKFLG
jgi:Fe-S cluster assembly protein SufD